MLCCANVARCCCTARMLCCTNVCMLLLHSTHVVLRKCVCMLLLHSMHVVLCTCVCMLLLCTRYVWQDACVMRGHANLSAVSAEGGKVSTTGLQAADSLRAPLGHDLISFQH
ncbi:hypothetical protein DUNSADRAFT_4199 [Dunaliella salina]|uniref:Encoded protein n=1 Tax=Dunaliella salina TaxID=3046 RepID=A0ABQ7GSH8_DUNSA|nr:hypothetical protein DUNSADRAFT_4199 [Dunaliella salina]|eukprot:KAF5837565.1 hypothetical protein DUNSADRAFT_4199 [Dunaliella salina]